MEDRRKAKENCMEAEIETEDLFLKKGKFDDWKNLFENLWRYEESARYMLWTTIKTEDEAKQRIKRVIEWQKNHLEYLVYEKKSRQAIGFAGMEEIKMGVYEDTGIAIGPKFAGQGYGKQILMALVNDCFLIRRAEKFICSCRSENIASKRMQMSCGFEYCYSEKRIDRRNGREYILEFYELLKTN